MNENTTKYQLSAESVDEISKQICDRLDKYEIRSENTVRIRIALEEVLLNILKNHGNGTELELKITKKLGDISISMVYYGDAFDPAGNDENDGMTAIMLRNMGMMPIWKYKNNHNHITFRVPANHIRLEVMILGAVLLALLLGLPGSLMPGFLRDNISKYVLDPIADIFMHLLAVFSGVLVFFSIIIGICGMGNSSESKGSGILA